MAVVVAAVIAAAAVTKVTATPATRRVDSAFACHRTRWVHPEYLLWWQSGMNLPPLVTTGGGTTRATAGVLPGASILYGGNDNALDGSRSGGRIRFGTWFDRFPGLGMEGEYFGLAQGSESFFQNSNGSPTLARPFFNITTGLQDAELVAFPNVLSGSVQVDVTSELNGAAARFRRSLCCSSGCAYSPFCCTTVPTSSRLDGTVGYRYYELKEALDIRERLQSTDTANPGSFNILDHFDTRNQFNGGEVGCAVARPSRFVEPGRFDASWYR